MDEVKRFIEVSKFLKVKYPVAKKKNAELNFEPSAA